MTIFTGDEYLSGADTFKRLVGATIKAAYIKADKTDIKLATDKGWFRLYTEGDCCSETWIEHVTNLANTESYRGSLIGRTVTGFEEIELGKAIPTRQEEDQLYGLKIKAEGEYGPIEAYIEFRNSSNGYYGGTLECVMSDDALDGFAPLVDDL